MVNQPDVPEQFDSFNYIPELQGWQRADSPSSDVLPLEVITEGRVFQRGPNLYRSGDSAYLGRVAYVRGATLERGSQGTFLLNNRVPRARVDDPMAVDRQPRLVISGDLTVLGDTVENPINRTISLAPRGELVYVKDDVPSGKERYAKTLAPAPGEPVPQRLVTGWRLATSEELILRGIAGYLARNATAVIERMKLAGLDLGDGTVTTSGSEIVRILAAQLDVSPVITYVLGEGR